MDFIAISKILAALIFPFNAAIALMIVALILLWLKRTKWAGGCLGLAVTILAVCGNPIMSHMLFANLERSYLPKPVTEYPQADAIVTLGGGLQPPLPPRLYADANSASDRYLHATRLYHAQRSPLVILSGGNVFTQKGFEGESYYAAQLIQEWGVPASAIIIEDQSRNTYENALLTKKLLADKNLKRILLVTSALHMRRALATFRSVGIDAIPSPTDYDMVESQQPQILNWIPNVGALGATTRLIHEYLGYLVYQYKGWINTEASAPG